MEMIASALMTQASITRVTNQQATIMEDVLAVEEPLEIRLVSGSAGNQTTLPLSVTMRTPGHDEDLATGFLFTEGIIKSSDEIDSVHIDPFNPNVVTVALREYVKPLLHNVARNFYTTSSCGVCGKASVDAIKTTSRFQQTPDNLRVGKQLLYSLPDKLRKHQQTFERTGGLHASALFDQQGELLMLREDVGRHNALDKLIGTCVASNIIPLDKHILLLSGRASFELIQKASMAGIRMVVAIGSPSSLAVALATEFGMTLVGFLKADRFNIYTGPDRILS
jgi:FdhD protein